MTQEHHEPYNGEAPFQAHSTTSKLAARAVARKMGPMHAKIVDYLERHPEGATDEQLGSALGLEGNTLRPRRRELQLRDRVMDSGGTAKTKLGHSAVIWKLRLVKHEMGGL